MEPNASHDRDLIAELRLHIDAAIKASPITCAELRFDAILEMVLKYGLNSKTRIKNFNRLRNLVHPAYSRAMARHQHDPGTKELVDRILAANTDPAISISSVNELVNDLYTKYGISDIVRDCEEVAVAYSASLRYAWAKATVLTRLIKDEGELEYMLRTRTFKSIGTNFVSTSVTKAPGLEYLSIMYRITITPRFRKNVFVLIYMSVFVYEYPEILRGYKQYNMLEDELRIKNCTPIEPGTLEIVFYDDGLSAAAKKALQEKYASLASVTFERWETS